MVKCSYVVASAEHRLLLWSNVATLSPHLVLRRQALLTLRFPCRAGPCGHGPRNGLYQPRGDATPQPGCHPESTGNGLVCGLQAWRASRGQCLQGDRHGIKGSGATATAPHDSGQRPGTQQHAPSSAFPQVARASESLWSEAGYPGRLSSLPESMLGLRTGIVNSVSIPASLGLPLHAGNQHGGHMPFSSRILRSQVRWCRS